ncbi:tyrosine kinase receptor Cad96Ca-like [Brevipalpus obovatus]|uniref:tyrosine kinase receptor Cad96Ca-like n=1 Tax=Brevipalpus obovatus TaxID=246614 RepID=UPI003D9F2B88
MESGICFCFSFLLFLGLSEQDELLNGSTIASELKLIPLDIPHETVTPSSSSTSSESSISTSSTVRQPDERHENKSNYDDFNESSNSMDDFIDHGKKPSRTVTSHTSSTRIYIVAIIGVVPAILGGCVYWLNYFRKTCFQAKRRKQGSDITKINGIVRSLNPSALQHYRYNDKNFGGYFGKFGSNDCKVGGGGGSGEGGRILSSPDSDSKKSNTSTIMIPSSPSSGTSSSPSSPNTSNYTKLAYSIEYPRKNLQLLQVLGEGNFGQVWKARVTHLRETYYVAVKTNKDDCSEHAWDDLLQELNIMLKLGKHSNVVRLLACCTEKVPYYLIMEYVECGKLLNYLRRYRKENSYYNDEYCRVAIADLILFSYHAAKGMEFISSYGIIHRDLAARNILVSRDRVCKVADFGLARSVNDSDKDSYEQKTRGAMPIRWMAPESLSSNFFTSKSDVWSFGILLWEILTLGSTPYPGLSATEVVNKVCNGYVMDRPLVRWCNDELYWLMRACWAMDAECRPNFTKIRQILGQMLSTHSDYADLSDLQSSAYYNIMYNSPGEKV